MRFRSNFLQRSSHKDAAATLKTIYDTYLTPDGRVEGEDEDVAKAVERAKAVTGLNGDPEVIS